MVEEDLPDVRDRVGFVCAVGVDGAVVVRDDVDVRRAAGVVAGEDRVPLGDAVIVGRLEAAEEGGILTTL